MPVSLQIHCLNSLHIITYVAWILKSVARNRYDSYWKGIVVHADIFFRILGVSAIFFFHITHFLLCQYPFFRTSVPFFETAES